MIDIALNEKELKQELRALDRRLALLPEAVLLEVQMVGLSAAITPVGKQVRAALRSRPVGDGKRHGYLARSIGRKSKRNKRQLFGWIVLGARSRTQYSPDGKRHNPANYGHLVEKGRGPGGWHRGPVKGKNIALPIWERNRSVMHTAYVRAARAGIPKAVSKVKAKAKR